MFITKELGVIALVALKDDLERMKQNPNEATELCIEVSERMIANIENGDLEIDSEELGYLDTVLFNYMPKTIEEYQALVNANYHLHKIWPKAVYPLRAQLELRKGFKWAIEEKKGIAIHIQMPDLEKPEIILNPFENLAKKIEYYEKSYTEDLELKTFNKIKIIGYELV